MRFVTPKSKDQLDIQALHRIRDRLVGQRTSLMNQIRGLLLERGLTTAQGRARLADFVDALLTDDEAAVSSRIAMVLKDMHSEWQGLDRRVKAFDAEFAAFAKSDEQANRLVSIPGIGPLTESALVAAVGDATSFAYARDLAAWIGLVPRQSTTGGKPRLVGITRRGNKSVVLGVLKREGELRAEVVSDTTAKTMQGMVRKNVEPGSVVITDEHRSYKGLSNEYAYLTVNHSKGHYVIGGVVHSNSIESVWALLKRQIVGIHHYVSPKHLSRYVDEMKWRFNRSDMDANERMNEIFTSIEGRMPWKVLTA